MTDKSKPSVFWQDDLLQQLQQASAPVSIYLKSGIKLTGTIVAHDAYSIVIGGANGIQQLVFKHAISTISPQC